MAVANLTYFGTFLTTVVQIPIAALPLSSPFVTTAFDFALEIVNLSIQAVSPFLYDTAVYNLATHFLLEWCPDQPDQTYFADTRTAMNLNGFVAGVVSSSSDEGTETGLTVPDFMRNLQMSDLSTLATPYGRVYMSIAQRVGPTLWGLS